MNNEQILLLVDQLFHEFASSYRSEARQRAVEKLTAHNTARDEICPHYYEDRVDLTGEGTNFEVMSCCRVMGKLSPVA